MITKAQEVGIMLAEAADKAKIHPADGRDNLGLIFIAMAIEKHAMAIENLAKAIERK